MEIKLNKEESEEHFFNAMCNGMGYFCQYGIQLEFDDDQYAAAKAAIRSEKGEDHMICREDIWIKILKDGGSIKFHDKEAEEIYETKIEDVHEKVQKTPIRHLMDAINENDDAITADCILQTVIIGEVVYG
jgi:hypothetical protein